MPNKIFCIVGMTGSGKSEVSDELVKNGFSYLRFGQITLDKIKERGLEVNETNEKEIREGFRKEYGMGAFAILNAPKLDELIKKSNVVVDGLYSWSEYKVLKEKYGNSMYVVAVYAPPEVRYQRLQKRKNNLDDKNVRFRSLTEEQAKKRDYAEIENVEKGGPIAMADFTISNIRTIDELRNNVKKLLSNMEKGKFFVFEGIDGSGKSTQTNLLAERLQVDGFQVEKIDFPQHGERSSAMVDDYLIGKYGSAKEVGPYVASIFYATDRYDASFKIREWLDEGKIVIADRYMVSNMGHQGGKIRDRQERKKYFDWLHNLEYNIFKIPKPDYTFILKTSPEVSLELSNKINDENKIERRKSYLGDDKKQDIHEKDKGHLAETLEAFLHVAEEYPEEFKVIECLNSAKLLPPEIIHQKIVEAIKNIL